ncbi:4930556J24Rik [Phodopus roborovskii]|uniref:4930556J24Rik protein n=1 Tax=Phodopus roborovskii TaxID=109678 RepID=A0AAU9ZYZ6_PHORO|nr:4930556J24Rik [Phodopus roborovskii]
MVHGAPLGSGRISGLRRVSFVFPEPPALSCDLPPVLSPPAEEGHHASPGERDWQLPSRSPQTLAARWPACRQGTSSGYGIGWGAKTAPGHIWVWALRVSHKAIHLARSATIHGTE